MTSASPALTASASPSTASSPSSLSATPAAAPPADAAGTAPLLAAQHAATRLTTALPDGAGDMVWHLWASAEPDPSLPPLVLLHGGSGSWTHWLRNVQALAASGRRVYVPDLPGFGDSAAPAAGGDVDVLPEPLEAGLQALLGDAPVDLVGFSFGGMAAGLLAAKYPARAARLVLVGAPGFGLSVAVTLRAWRHQADAAARETIHRNNLAALMVRHPATIDDTALRLHVDNVGRDRLRHRSLSRTDILRRQLPQLRCPVWAIFGEADAIYPGNLDEVERALHEAPQFRGMTRIADAGHWVQYERAEAFDAALLRVLGEPAGD